MRKCAQWVLKLFFMSMSLGYPLLYKNNERLFNYYLEPLLLPSLPLLTVARRETSWLHDHCWLHSVSTMGHKEVKNPDLEIDTTLGEYTEYWVFQLWRCARAGQREQKRSKLLKRDPTAPPWATWRSVFEFFLLATLLRRDLQTYCCEWRALRGSKNMILGLWGPTCLVPLNV